MDDLTIIKSCYFEWLKRLRAFGGIKATLAVLIISAADHIRRFGKYQNMFVATADLRKVIF